MDGRKLIIVNLLPYPPFLILFTYNNTYNIINTFSKNNT